jgi:hypothetical protein
MPPETKHQIARLSPTPVATREDEEARNAAVRLDCSVHPYCRSHGAVYLPDENTTTHGSSHQLSLSSLPSSRYYVSAVSGQSQTFTDPRLN